MTDHQNEINNRADDIMEFALAASGGDEADALEFVCEGIDSTATDRLVEKYMQQWGEAEQALIAASFKASIKEKLREEME